uniref:Cytochrome P450 n=1 Tax=Acrobeloides nanus TaxID=290746 RepID=A0A914C4L3_9BILA
MDFFLDAESTGPLETSDPKMLSKKLTTKEIASQCFIFLIAGFDTTSTTLASICYYLARNPSKQHILLTEIDDLSEGITFERLQELKYMDAVIKETLRLVPPASL